MRTTMLKTDWIGLKGAMGQAMIPGQQSMVPVAKNGGSGNPPPPDYDNGGNDGGGSCPPGCGCHPLWYIGSAVGVMMVLTTLLARA